MTPPTVPLRLEPVFKEKIWGRKDSHPSLPRFPEGDRKLGEIWMTDGKSKFADGPLKGKTLADATRELGSDLCGTAWKQPRFPILAKYILTDDWLSLQVHPDDEYAKAHEPDTPGKAEMWYFIHCPPQGRILYGLKDGATPEQLQSAARAGTLKNLIPELRPNPGEAFMVAPGRLHAIGPALVLFEVEQNSDITYRLDDFGRVGIDGQPRPLHLEKAMAVMRFDLPRSGATPELRFPEPFGSRLYLVACRHFGVEHLTCEKEAPLVAEERRVEILTFLGGQGQFHTANGPLPFATGQTWLVPPRMSEGRLMPEGRCEMLRYYVPDLEKDFVEPLRARGVSESQIRSVVYSL